MRAGKQIVLTPKCQLADRILHTFIVNLEDPILQVAAEDVPPLGYIGQAVHIGLLAVTVGPVCKSIRQRRSGSAEHTQVAALYAGPAKASTSRAC